MFRRQVWRLVNGLLTSANAMVSTLVLVVLTLYIAACLGAACVCVCACARAGVCVCQSVILARSRNSQERFLSLRQVGKCLMTSKVTYLAGIEIITKDTDSWSLWKLTFRI